MVFSRFLAFLAIMTTLVWLAYMIFVLVAKADHFWLYAFLGIQILANYFAVEWMNEAYENYTFILYKTVLVRLGYIISIFVFVRTPADILPYAAIASLVVYFNNLFGYLYIKRNHPFMRVPLREVLSLVKPLFPVMLLSNAGMLFFMLDRLFLSVFSSVQIYITYYTFSMLILMAIINVVSSIMFVSVPRLSNYISNRNDEEYRRLLQISSHAFFLIMMPVCAGITALGREAMFLYGGTRYIGAGTTLAVFGLAFIVYAIDWSLYNQVLFIQGKEMLLLKIYGVGGGINLALNTVLLLIGRLTPVYLVSTTAISLFFVILFQHLSIRRIWGVGFSPLDKTTVKYILLSLCFLPISAFFRHVFQVSLVLDRNLLFFMLTVFIVCVSFYAAVLYTSGDSVYMHLLGKIRNRLRRFFVPPRGNH